MPPTDPQSHGQGPPPPAPKQPWEPLTLRARPAPVTRLNRKVVGVLLALGMGLVAFALSTGLRSPQPPTGATDAAAHGPTTPPEGLGRLPQRYSDIKHPVVAVAATPPPPPAPPPPVPVAVRQPPPAQPKGPTPEELAAAEARRKAREAAEKARTSELFFPPNGHSAPPPQAQERLQAALAGTPPGNPGTKQSEVVEKYFMP